MVSATPYQFAHYSADALILQLDNEFSNCVFLVLPRYDNHGYAIGHDVLPYKIATYTYVHLHHIWNAGMMAGNDIETIHKNIVQTYAGVGP